MSGGSSWSRDEDVAFERAVAIYNNETEDFWEKIAAAVPGKTLEQVKEHYQILASDVMMIESGCVPLPDYVSPEETSDNTSDKGKSVLESGDSSTHESDQQEDKSEPRDKRRKGIAWTASEHKKFLLGLDKYGKGDWRSISRNYVISRTPTQVASHAQKYFARQKSTQIPKVRSSIHDVIIGENGQISKITRRRPITWRNTQATSQQSLDNPMFGTSSTLNTQATSQQSVDHPLSGTSSTLNTQVTSQQSPDHLMHANQSMWSTQAISQPLPDLPVDGNQSMWSAQAISQPLPDLPMDENQSMWSAQAISQPLPDLPMDGNQSMWSAQAISQPSPDLPMDGNQSMWSTQAISQPLPDLYGNRSMWNTQAISQPLPDLLMYGNQSMWSNQPFSQPLPDLSMYENQSIWSTQAISQPLPDLPMYGTTNIWNTQATSQPTLLDIPTYGTSNIWTTQDASQQTINNPNYGVHTIDQSMAGPVLTPFGSDMNLVAPPHMAYEGQHQFVPNYSPVPNASSGMSSMPYNSTYMP